MPAMRAMGGLGSGKGSDMVIAHRGEGTAIFDLKEGIFIEREINYKYGQKGEQQSVGMALQTMRGTLKERWEMERR